MHSNLVSFNVIFPTFRIKSICIFIISCTFYFSAKFQSSPITCQNKNKNETRLPIFFLSFVGGFCSSLIYNTLKFYSKISQMNPLTYDFNDLCMIEGCSHVQHVRRTFRVHTGVGRKKNNGKSSNFPQSLHLMQLLMVKIKKQFHQTNIYAAQTPHSLNLDPNFLFAPALLRF